MTVSDQGVIIRPALPDDALEIARLILMAGAGVYEFQLDGLFGDIPLDEVIASGVAGTVGNFSHRMMAVAVTEADDAVVGLVHGFPTEWMRTVERGFIPADRLDHLTPFDGLQDWEAYFVSALAVAPEWRRRGLGARLIDWLEARARTGGHPRLSLHVWSDNPEGIAFYRRLGFHDAGHADIPWHPRLPHHGGSRLFLRDVTAPDREG